MKDLTKILILIYSTLAASLSSYSQYNIAYDNSVHPFLYSSRPNFLPCTPNGFVKDSLNLNKVSAAFEFDLQLAADSQNIKKIVPHLRFRQNGNFYMYNKDSLLSKPVFFDLNFQLGVKFKSKHLITTVGLCHQSNGMDLILSGLSRSSDVVFTMIEYNQPNTHIAILGQLPIFPKYRLIQNPDLFDYWSYIQLYFTQKVNRYEIKVDVGLRSLETTLRYNIKERFAIQLLSANGYPDNQIVNYNIRRNEFGLGFVYK